MRGVRDLVVEGEHGPISCLLSEDNPSREMLIRRKEGLFFEQM